MTQHIFIDSNYQVFCGWDRPLQGYFLVITIDGFDEPSYSNLDEAISHPDSFDPFLKVLDKFRLTLPVGLLDALEEDKLNNVGNKLTRW